MLYRITCCLILSLITTLPSSLTAKVAEGAAKANNEAGLKIYSQVRKDAGNQLFSPYSANTPLAIVISGARGTTRAQAIQALNLSNDIEGLLKGFGELNQKLQVVEDNPLAELWGDFVHAVQNTFGDETPRRTVELHSANSLWTDNSFALNAEFETGIEDDFGDILRRVDFKGGPNDARLKINEWVEDQTRDRIQDLLAEGTIDADTALVLVNALYMNAAWDHPFNEKLTSEATWTDPEGSEHKRDLMYQSVNLPYLEGPGFTAIELPYVEASEGNPVKLAMHVYLPGDYDELEDLERRLVDNQGLLLLDDKDWKTKKVNVWLPKFKGESTLDLGLHLQRLGMRQAFTPAADFTGIAEAQPFFISDVVQKTFIDVSESGTEAAAATGIVMTTRAAVPTEQFRADHPFLYTIVDKGTGTLLFIGRVANPEQD